MIINTCPLRGWALDLIGEIKPASSKSHIYVLVGIDYFTKWVEAVPLTNVEQDTGNDFIQSHIMCRYGNPETIPAKRGSVFVGKKIMYFTAETGIKFLMSIPYCAQANDQVEATNEVIISLINNNIGKKPRSLHTILNQALWACRTSPKKATNATPFRLTFDHNALLPAEIRLELRIKRKIEIPSDHFRSMMMDALVDLDKERLIALDALVGQKKRIAKVFSFRDYIWKVILPLNKKDIALGKWSPDWEGPFKVNQVVSNNAYEIEELNSDN